MVNVNDKKGIMVEHHCKSTLAFCFHPDLATLQQSMHYGLTREPVPSQRFSVFEGCISVSMRL